MQVIHGLSESSEGPSHCAVAIGNFDGIHLGHRALLSQMVEGARALSLIPSVLTFYPHPVEVLNPQKKLEQLSTTTEKLDLIEQLGVKSVCIAKFDHTLAELSPEDFFEKYLVNGLKAKAVFVGFNFKFGKNRIGDTALLKKLCEEKMMSLTVVEPVSVVETLPGILKTRVSSSFIREKLIQGKIEEATLLLGRPSRISGMVRPGDGRGKQIGFPTANLYCAKEKVLPQNGVYVTRVKWQLQYFLSITNVGIRPTFKIVNPEKLVEVHILGLNAQLYDESLELDFLSFVREEKKFDSIEQLKTQIQKDILIAKNCTLFDTL